MRLCSAGALYILTLFTFKRIVRKILGFKVPRTREPVSVVLPKKMIASFQSDSVVNTARLISIFLTGLQAYSFY